MGKIFSDGPCSISLRLSIGYNIQSQGNRLSQKLGGGGRVSPRANVVFHSMGRIGHHIAHVDNGRVFFKQDS